MSDRARELVDSEAVDLETPKAAVAVGVTGRTCARTSRERAMPSLRHPLRIDENVRGASLYSLRIVESP